MSRLVLVLMLMVGAPAAAQDAGHDAAEARAALESGDLLAAGTALDRGLMRAEMSREELLELYQIRALVAYADDRLGMLEESLQALASLGAPMPALFPPPLRARYAEVQASPTPIELSVEIVAEVAGDRRALHLVPRAMADPGALVRSLHLRAAVDEAPLTLHAEGDVLDAGSAHAVVDVRYVLEALGPGGTLVAHLGDEATPMLEQLDGLPVDETFLHVALVTAGSVLVLGAIAFGMAYLATDGFTAAQPTTIGPVACSGAACGSLVSF